MEDSERPGLAVSIIVCTRDRGAALLPAIHSILADAPTDDSVELLVMDQSDGDSVRQALATIPDARLQYRCDSTRGLSAARNAGVRASRGELIVFTDDDCVVEPGWLAAIAQTFAAQPKAGVVFGEVACAEYDASAGFLPGFRAQEGPLTRRRMLAGAGHWGMGANMALRRSTFDRVGPFDERLGAGAALKSAEDSDYALRATEAEIGIYLASAVCVTHYGFRPKREAKRLLCDAAHATGAMYAKHARNGYLFALKLMYYDLSARLRDIIWHVIHKRRLTGLNALRYELTGFVRGWRMPFRRAGKASTPIFVTPPTPLPAANARLSSAGDVAKRRASEDRQPRVLSLSAPRTPDERQPPAPHDRDTE
jgi:glycosyltransferase involved in cell wall biosynthesis